MWPELQANMRPGGTQRIPRVRSRTITGSGLAELAPETTQFSKRIPEFRILMQCLFCIAAVVLGFRVTHEADLIRIHFSRVEEASERFSQSDNHTAYVGNWSAFKTGNTTPEITTGTPGVKSSGVYVGRHPILVRPWPHPNPIEMAQAYNTIARVQLEQQRLYGIKTWKPIIAITPTYVRTFQSVHLTGLLHTLSLVRGPVTWIVVEAGGVSAETTALLSQAKVHKLVHLGASEPVPRSLQDRGVLESHLRIEGLRYVRDQNLEGVVVFADDSNVYSMAFFDEVQKVQWVGALPVGILGHAGFEDSRSRDSLKGSGDRVSRRHLLAPLQEMLASRRVELPVQGPACDSFGSIKGWHAFGSLSLDGDLVERSRDEETNLEWAGFVLNARAVWASEPDRPKWIKEWMEWAHPEVGQYIELRSIVSDESKVEALGHCGSEEAVLLWWSRMEARSDSKYPSRWTLDSPLGVVVPARRTPWPDRIFPLSPPPPPAGQTSKRKGGNRSVGGDGKTRRGKRRPDAVKSRVLDKEIIVSKGKRS